MTTAVRKLIWLIGLGALVMSGVAPAQTLRSSSGLVPTQTIAPGQTGARTADFIVALVNSEPVTNNEVRQRLIRIEQQLAQQGAVMPPRQELARQVMELLVSERAQLQAAQELGLRVDDAALEQAVQNIAAQNQLSPAELRSRLAAQGTDLNRFRSELRDQLLLRKVRERETERIRVSNAEIEQHLQDLNRRNPDRAEVNLSQVLIKVPESASPDATRTLQAKAQAVATRARAGEDFAALARDLSEGPESAAGGSFGWRRPAQLPTLFVQATGQEPVGSVVGPIRSPAGWHVLKIMDRRQGTAPELMMVQSHVSHILLRPSASLDLDAAQARLAALRDQISKGSVTFEASARQFSQDGSAPQGGDLGWVSPGQFVPEFEAVMDTLKPGELSQPMVSRFGAHLIRLEERREVAMTPEQQAEAARNALREKKVEERLQTWAQEVRAIAFVEFRDAPRP